MGLGEGVRGKGSPPFSDRTQYTAARKMIGNAILSAANKAKSSLQVTSVFPRPTSTQQTQEFGTFNISCQITVISMVNQNQTPLNWSELDDEESESLLECKTLGKSSGSDSSGTDSTCEGSSELDTSIVCRFVLLSFRFVFLSFCLAHLYTLALFLNTLSGTCTNRRKLGGIGSNLGPIRGGAGCT